MIQTHGWTPRPMPLNYDALEEAQGCRSISGNNFGAVTAFVQLCVAAHDSNHQYFSREDTVSNTKGPADATAPAFPYLTDWCFWVGSESIRGDSGISDITPPADASGSQSTLYPATTPSRLSTAFDDGGFCNIAIQKTATSIEIKRYTSDTETTKITFEGFSPALFYTGIVATHATEDVACYYLKADNPRTLFVRLQSEDFEDEHVVHAGLTNKLAALIQVDTSLGQVILYARDIDGNDLQFKTQPVLTGGAEEATLELSIVSGSYFAQNLDAGTVSDDALLDTSITSGKYAIQTVTIDAVAEEARLVVSVAEGNYSKI